MVGEIHPKWKHIHFTPHTLLDRELGLDSLARMELRNRIERMFNISLDEKAAVCAYTPHDLMQVIIAQDSGVQTVGTAQAETMRSLQTDAGTLLMGGRRSDGDRRRLRSPSSFCNRHGCVSTAVLTGGIA